MCEAVLQYAELHHSAEKRNSIAYFFIDGTSWPRIRSAGNKEVVLDLFVESSMLDQIETRLSSRTWKLTIHRRI